MGGDFSLTRTQFLTPFIGKRCLSGQWLEKLTSTVHISCSCRSVVRFDGRVIAAAQSHIASFEEVRVGRIRQLRRHTVVYQDWAVFDISSFFFFFDTRNVGSLRK